jgi:hypothetical protein
MKWRQDCANTFRFNPAQAIPSAEIRQLEARFFPVKRDLIAEIEKGPSRLQWINQKAAIAREPLESELLVSMKNCAQTKADLEATPKAEPIGTSTKGSPLFSVGN